MDFLTKLAEGFIGLFNAGGATFSGWVTGIIPTLVVLITAINAVIKLVGEEKVNSAMKVLSKFTITRYTLMPMLAMFFLCNPMAYSFGRFLKEEHKPAFYDATVSFCHPITGLFPHANAGELFVWLGISDGVAKLGLNTTGLALRYFIVGLIVIFLRGFLCEKLYAIMAKRG